MASLLLGCGAMLCVPVEAQTGDPDPTQPPTSPTAQGAAGRGTRTHDAGSIEASGPEMRDRMFLRRSAADGLLEVKLGELAQSKGQSDEVKSFGKRMVEDHTTINESLRPIAEAQGVMLPTKLPPREKATFDRMEGLTGEAFDREYIKTMVHDHHEDLHAFRAESASTQDATLREATQRASRLIHEHMVMVFGMAQARGLVPPRPPKDDVPPPPPPPPPEP